MTEPGESPLPEERSGPTRWSGWNRFTTFIAPIAAVFIMLGEATDASYLLRDAGTEMVALVSNRGEYDTLSKIHVGNTLNYVEGLVGDAQVSRSVGAGVTANFYFDSKYLLTIFERDGRVDAYSVIALVDGFGPKVQLREGDESPLGEFTFADTERPSTESAVDESRVTRYYVESLEPQGAGLLVDLYLGSVQYGVNVAGGSLGDLYQSLIMGNENAEETAISTLRRDTLPNLYGEGDLPLEMIRAALLTNAEFNAYVD